jgi:hypothetical protein
MEKTQKREAEISTYKDAQLFKALFDVLRASMAMTRRTTFANTLNCGPNIAD